MVMDRNRQKPNKKPRADPDGQNPAIIEDNSDHYNTSTGAIHFFEYFVL